MATVAAAAVLLAAPVRLLHAQVAATVRVSVHATAPAQPPRSRDADAPLAAAPVRGATVAVRGAGLAAVTDARGVAVLRGLVPGRHALAVSALGYAEATIEVEAVNGRVARASVALDPAPVAIAGLDVRVASRAGGAGATVIETADLPPAVADLPAALDRVAGATVVRRGGPGAPATVQLRGSGSDQVLVLLDGAAINSPLTGVADLATVDLASISRIVVIPGAQSARHGGGALGGVVLLESRDAAAPAASLTASVGSWSTARAAVAASRGFGAWSLSGGARWRRSDGAFTYDVPDFRGGGEAARENAAFAHAGADVRIARRGAMASSLRIHFSDVERGSPGGIGQPSPSGRQRHGRWGAAARIEAAAGGAARLAGSARAGVQWQDAEYQDPSPPFGRAYETLTRVRRAEVAVEGRWRVGARGDGLRAGLHAARLDVESSVLGAGPIGLDELGAWARAGHAWAPEPGLDLEAGAAIRVDRHDLVEGATASPAVDATLTRGGLALTLRWGRGFAPPGLGDLFFHEGVLVEPNPDLAPERIRGEVAATVAQRWSLGPVAGEARATAYRADIDDMVLWFPDHRFVWRPDNHDVARRGIEVAATADLAALGRVHTLSANAEWSRVEYAAAALGGQVAYRPAFTADASLDVALPGGVVFAPSATHVGERRTVPGSALNALGAYTLLNAGIAVPLAFGQRAGRLDLALANLLDERAALLADYPLPGRGWSMRVRIGAGR